LIELAILTILGALFIAIEKPSQTLLIMFGLQLLCLLPGHLSLDLNLMFVLLLMVLPAVIVMMLTKKKSVKIHHAKASDFILYTSLIIIISGVYILTTTTNMPSQLGLVEQKSGPVELWTIAVIIVGAVMGILPRLKKK